MKKDAVCSENSNVSIIVHMKVPKVFKDQVKELAHLDQRTVSGLTRKILDEYVHENKDLLKKQHSKLD